MLMELLSRSYFINGVIPPLSLCFQTMIPRIGCGISIIVNLGDPTSMWELLQEGSKEFRSDRVVDVAVFPSERVPTPIK